MKNNSIQVSIITPAYNPGEAILETLKSLQRQKFRDFEWIVIDDGSESSHESFFNKIEEEKLLSCTVIRLESNVGQSRARNIGINSSVGCFIKFLDSDDLLDEDHLLKLVMSSDISESNKIIKFAPTKHVYVESVHTHINKSYQLIESDSEKQLIQLLVAPFIHHCGALFPRKLLTDLNGYDESLVTDEDGDLLIRVLLSGWIFSVVPDVFYMYIHHSQEGRVSIDDTIEKLESRKHVCLKLISYYSDNDKQMSAPLKNALCKRIDKISVDSWNSQRTYSASMLSLAESLKKNYEWSGSKIEKIVRLTLGLTVSVFAINLYRRINKSFLFK